MATAPGAAASGAGRPDGNTPLVGSAAQQSLRHNLTRSEPLAFIQRFQQKNGLGEWSNSRAALPLVDLQGVSRPEVYHKLLIGLRNRLLGRLQGLSAEKMKDLLAQTFPYIQLPEIRPVVLEVLRLHKVIPPDFLQALSVNAELMESCAIEVKRQVWQHRPKLFLTEVRPRLLAYTTKLKRTATNLGLNDYDKFSPRKRRDIPEVKELLKLIGKSVPLYNETLRAIRTHFIETGDPGCCALRTDLLMGLSDTGITAIVKRDPLQQFVECLIICVTDRKVDEKKAATLSKSLEAVEVGPMIGDIGMVILDPCIQVTLSKACFAAVQECVDVAILPARSRHLQNVTQLYASVSLDKIRTMMRDQAFERLEMPDHQILPWFFPTIAGALVEDRITAAMRSRDPTSRGNPHAAHLSPQFGAVLQAVPALRVVVIHYIQERLRAKDIASVGWALPILADTVTGEWVYGDHDEGSVDEQFARLLAVALTTALRTPFAAAGPVALRMLATFFVPRAKRSAVAHTHAVAMAAALRADVTEANTDGVDAAIGELCTEGVVPAASAGEGGGLPTLISQYEGLADVVPRHLPVATVVTRRIDALQALL